MTKTDITVWAPCAESVRLHAWGQQIALERCPCFSVTGNWSCPDLPESITQEELHNFNYMLSIDDGPQRPDPRSLWQPQGYAGPSRRFDHRTFAWSDQRFQARPLSAAVIYELHIGTFTPDGTFESAIEKLQDLVELGITHVELMPVSEFPGEYGWGYDGVYLFAPHHRYGGPQGLKKLVNACHEHGLAVILDVVYNHIGPIGNFLHEFGPYFSTTHKTPWGTAFNFDGPHSDGVRRFFCDNAIMWLRDYHMDALRLDAVHAIVDTSSLPFLEQLATEVAELAAHLGRHLSLMAESDLNDPRLLRSAEAGGFGLDAQWCDDFHHALHTALTGEREGYYTDFGDVRALAHAFEHPYLYTGQHSKARDRRHGRPAHYLNGHRFITFSQNHDQIGNRAGGERLGHLVGSAKAKVAAAILLFSPHIPLLFQGEEFNCQEPFLYFADWREHPELAEAVRIGRQQEFATLGWNAKQSADPIALETFQRCQIQWQESTQSAGQEIWQWYRTLIMLRKHHSVLTNGNFQQLETNYCPIDQWLCVRRGDLLLACNLSDQPRTIPLPNCETDRCWRTLLASEPEIAPAPTEGQSIAQVTLPVHAVCILQSFE